MECYEACPLNDCWAKICSWLVCDVSVIVWIYKWCGLGWSVSILRLAFDDFPFDVEQLINKFSPVHGLMVVDEMMVDNIKSWRIDFESGFSLEGTWSKTEITWSLLALYYFPMGLIPIRIILFWTMKKGEEGISCII